MRFGVRSLTSPTSIGHIHVTFFRSARQLPGRRQQQAHIGLAASAVGAKLGKEVGGAVAGETHKQVKVGTNRDEIVGQLEEQMATRAVKCQSLREALPARRACGPARAPSCRPWRICSSAVGLPMSWATVACAH